jgi:membrane glycosyltransferase
MQPAASNNGDFSSNQIQVTHPEHPTAHVEQQQRATSVIAESTNEPKVSLFALFFSILFNPVLVMQFLLKTKTVHRLWNPMLLSI